MATKDPVPDAPEEQKPDSSSKKRKSNLTEIQVDLSLPEPPSKKARRALKKGKSLPAKASSSDDEDDKAAKDGKPDGVSAGDKKKKKKERSPYGVWIGNLRFNVTKADLRKWLVDNSGGSITEESITRVHMPTTKPSSGAEKAVPQNRGFAYVDFDSFEANVAAIALSENELNGRKLLIKDSKNFEGRPQKEEPEPVAANGAPSATANNKTGNGSSSTKIFVGNLSFNTTEDDLYAHFEKCGKIRWIKVATFEDSGKCKGYGWVNFEDPQAAAWAVKGFVKVRETVDTLEDFMDVDEKGNEKEEKEGGKDGNKKGKASAADGEDEEEAEEEDNEPESKPASKQTKTKTAKQKEPPRTRTRKWWVNQLLGRNLKIELAEDDQTRYHKRFGKGAKQRQQQQKQQEEGGKQGSQKKGRTKNATSSSSSKGGGGKEGGHDGGDGDDAKKKSSSNNNNSNNNGPNYATDISVARLTGAAVAPQGKKVTFD
ncbi:hypothetical protein VTK26DRAFT_9133 [Humicola hyalothermophila]